MKKKFVKYGKILLALTLIGALALPSYATVGASDGSAFVTKAEFDAALSDFNARLTTFEAGINSKIDSQVSSYLDRNGIWNGKTQTLTEDAFKGKLTFIDDLLTLYTGGTTKAGVWQGDWYSSGVDLDRNYVQIPSGGAWWIKDNHGYRKGTSFTVIEEVNKSGLLFGTLCTGTYCGASWITNYNNEHKSYYDSPTYYLGAFLQARQYWTSQSQVKKLSDYDSGNGYANIGPIPYAWGRAIDVSSATYVQLSTNNWSDVAWEQKDQEINSKQYTQSNPPRQAFVYGGIYYDELTVSCAPKLYVVQMFVQKGQKLQARWGWRILGNAFHIATASSNPAFLFYAPPTSNGATVHALPKECFAQIIQFPNLVVY